MSIHIGDNNKIIKSTFNDGEKNKSWAEKHPVLISLLCSLVIGFIMLFSFWNDIVVWIEGRF